MAAMLFTREKMSEKLTQEEKRFLLHLARRTIEHFFKTSEKLELKPHGVPSQKLIENGACFVTLYINGSLRGCIGTLESKRPLVFDVIENALAAAFGDPRFYPLKTGELQKIKITISVLTKPEKLPVKNPEELLEKLVPLKHGLIIKQGFHRSTYLPAVWEQIPDKIKFVSELCQKAGLLPDAWKDSSTEFFTYEVEELSE